jgi:hypothetical protein
VASVLLLLVARCSLSTAEVAVGTISRAPGVVETGAVFISTSRTPAPHINNRPLKSARNMPLALALGAAHRPEAGRRSSQSPQPSGTTGDIAPGICQ